MPIIRTIWQRVYIAFAELSWAALGAAFLLHGIATWILLAATGETDLTGHAVTFLYYYVTTATTVGYGDLSPSGQAGRLATLIFVLPGSIALFTAFLGKAVADIGSFWRRNLNGLGDFGDRAGHTIVVGWQGMRTRKLVEGLLDDALSGEKPILLAPGLEQNPMPQRIDFILADNLSDALSFRRAGAEGASVIVVRGKDDDETLAATLAARAAAPDARVVAHFEDEGAAKLIRRQVHGAEAITSVSTDLLVRSARDPGASQLADLMFSSRTADTAYSLQVPSGIAPVAYLDALAALKHGHDMTLIGLNKAGSEKVDLNCASDCTIEGGDTIFYIADERCDPRSLDWAGVTKQVAA